VRLFSLAAGRGGFPSMQVWSDSKARTALPPLPSAVVWPDTRTASSILSDHTPNCMGISSHSEQSLFSLTTSRIRKFFRCIERLKKCTVSSSGEVLGLLACYLIRSFRFWLWLSSDERAISGEIMTLSGGNMLDTSAWLATYHHARITHNAEQLAQLFT
jgi:hypothetical protein